MAAKAPFCSVNNAALDLPGCRGIGEIRGSATGSFIATIEPMHYEAAVYRQSPGADASPWTRQVLHGLARRTCVGVGRFPWVGRDQIVAAWRMPNAEKKVGIKLYVPLDNAGERWQTYVIDDQTACEDLKIADLDGDGRPDIIAAGRASHDLVIFWNRNGKPR